MTIEAAIVGTSLVFILLGAICMLAFVVLPIICFVDLPRLAKQNNDNKWLWWGVMLLVFPFSPIVYGLRYHQIKMLSYFAILMALILVISYLPIILNLLGSNPFSNAFGPE